MKTYIAVKYDELALSKVMKEHFSNHILAVDGTQDELTHFEVGNLNEEIKWVQDYVDGEEMTQELCDVLVNELRLLQFTLNMHKVEIVVL